MGDEKQIICKTLTLSLITNRLILHPCYGINIEGNGNFYKIDRRFGIEVYYKICKRYNMIILKRNNLNLH